MPKKFLPLALAALVSCALARPAVTARAQAAPDAPQQQAAAAKIKAEVAALGAGARVRVKLRGGERLTGYVAQVNEQDFVVTVAKEGAKRTLPYADAVEVRLKNEKRVSTAGKILIGLGALWIMGMIATGGGG